MAAEKNSLWKQVRIQSHTGIKEKGRLGGDFSSPPPEL